MSHDTDGGSLRFRRLHAVSVRPPCDGSGAQRVRDPRTGDRCRVSMSLAHATYALLSPIHTHIHTHRKLAGTTSCPCRHSSRPCGSTSAHTALHGGRSFVRQPTRYVTAHAGSSAVAFPRSRGAKYLHPPLHTPTVGGRKQGATHARAQLVGWAGSTTRKSKASTAASSESGS